jgi:NTP pyrophosphatase (non-canonical NTP hydrolase)
MGLLDKVKETAQKGADLAKDGVKAGQDKIDEQKLKKKVSDLKEELGDVVYAQKSGTTPAGVDAEVEIARIVAELNAAVAELPDEDDDASVDEATS